MNNFAVISDDIYSFFNYFIAVFEAPKESGVPDF